MATARRRRGGKLSSLIRPATAQIGASDRSIGAHKTPPQTGRRRGCRAIASARPSSLRIDPLRSGPDFRGSWPGAAGGPAGARPTSVADSRSSAASPAPGARVRPDLRRGSAESPGPGADIKPNGGGRSICARPLIPSDAGGADRARQSDGHESRPTSEPGDPTGFNGCQANFSGVQMKPRRCKCLAGMTFDGSPTAIVICPTVNHCIQFMISYPSYEKAISASKAKLFSYS